MVGRNDALDAPDMRKMPLRNAVVRGSSEPAALPQLASLSCIMRFAPRFLERFAGQETARMH